MWTWLGTITLLPELNTGELSGHPKCWLQASSAIKVLAAFLSISIGHANKMPGRHWAACHLQG
jgi:hypothetical protein